jgi:hypothetical protein
MLKPLTLSVSLALALGACGVSVAGHHNNEGCSTCGIASPQGTVASPQSYASPQSCETCAPAKKHCFKMPKLPKMSLPKCTYTYEWVLKKKKHWSHGNQGCGGCGNSGCNECGGESIYPTSQVAPTSQAPWAAPQAAPYGAPQAAPYGTGQAAPYGTGQHTFNNPGEMRPALAADEVPPAPTIANQSSLLQLTPSGN